MDEDLWRRACSDKTRRNVFKSKGGRIRLDIRKKLFAVRVARCWPRLPRAAVGAPSVAGLKARLDGAGSSLGWGEGALPLAVGWDWVVLKVPSNPTHSMSL